MFKAIAFAAMFGVCISQSAYAEQDVFGLSFSDTQVRHELLVAPTYYGWMSGELKGAWRKGYTGQGTSIIVVDDYLSGDIFPGDFGFGVYSGTHGEWTLVEAGLVAPNASMFYYDYTNSASGLGLEAGFNVINCSYAEIALAGYSPSSVFLGALDDSIIYYAKSGSAVVVKAAGNYGVAVNGAKSGYQDYFNLKLIGAKSAIFVGALTSNGTVNKKARLASYSNRAGGNKKIQSHFMVVGVNDKLTGLPGTSFAAPIVSGYAAILHSKFKTASPTKIVNQLLSTARKNTIVGYKRSIHGVGEASITRALAPKSLN